MTLVLVMILAALIALHRGDRGRGDHSAPAAG